MEGASATVLRRLRGYWRRKGYERLDGSGRRGQKGRRMDLARLGAPRPRRRSWRIRVVPKLRFLRRCSPGKFLRRLRDAYVKMMLSFANSRILAGTGYGGAVGYGGAYGFGSAPRKEYDDKMIVEIYKVMLAQTQSQALRRDAACGGSNAAAAGKDLVCLQ
ncbi:uncharacterized protein LOC131155294 [Malania oleifera]|uniref:uncharacterized protein LOC131155294 n=1 Tax=Malania oleifera TaxID=397392 RepID=UPI0025AE7BA4|nr:uncharacterized protein LOC131155294 [Malania oleifera]